MQNALCVKLDHFNDLLQLAVEFALELEPGRGGGYVCVADPDDGIPIHTQLCGDISKEKAIGCHAFAQEKTRRLATHPEHKSSHESRDVQDTDKTKHKYGGAVRTVLFLISFSGFSEKLDEAIVLYISVRLGFLSDNEAQAIADNNGNEKYLALREKIDNYFLVSA